MGMALALPAVLALILGTTASSGFGALRLTLILGMLGAYVLLHQPEVSI